MIIWLLRSVLIVAAIALGAGGSFRAAAWLQQAAVVEQSESVARGSRSDRGRPAIGVSREATSDRSIDLRAEIGDDDDDLAEDLECTAPGRPDVAPVHFWSLAGGRRLRAKPHPRHEVAALARSRDGATTWPKRGPPA